MAVYNLVLSWCTVVLVVVSLEVCDGMHSLVKWCWWNAWLCVNACCIYSVKPTWRHGTASALTSLISILPRGEGHLHRAESVLQNCVMGRCAICIFMYCYNTSGQSQLRSPAHMQWDLQFHWSSLFSIPRNPGSIVVVVLRSLEGKGIPYLWLEYCLSSPKQTFSQPGVN